MKPQALMIGIILLGMCTMNYSDKVQKEETKHTTYLNINKDKVITYDIQEELYKSLPKATLEEKEVTKEPEWINVILTGYCDCNICTQNTKNKGITASGVRASRGTVALPSEFDFGVKLVIPDLNREFVNHDRGGAIKRIDQNTIKADVWFPTHKEALAFGKQKLKGYIKKQ